VAEPFPIGDREKADLARVLRLERLPSELCDAISQAIGCYRATEAGSGGTTVANVLAAALNDGFDESWRQCRRFAVEVFTITGIDHADFEAHPERLTEYLRTDVSFG
jgi:hypothetical protein